MNLWYQALPCLGKGPFWLPLPLGEGWGEGFLTKEKIINLRGLGYGG